MSAQREAAAKQSVVMLPLKEKDKPIVQKLLSAGCCARCILRFCCVNVHAAYRKPPDETLSELKTFIRDGGIVDSQDSSPAGGAEAEKECEDPPSKKAKLEVEHREELCVSCLGVLQHVCDSTQAVKIAEAVKKEKYEFDAMVLSVSLPAQLCVREHSCWLHVKSDVRAKSSVLDKDDVIQVKEVFKWIMQGLVARELDGVAVITKAPLDVGVEFTHPETDADCHFLASECADCFKPTKNKQSVFTRMAVVKALEKITDSKFFRHFPAPPPRPTSSCSAQDVQCLHTSVYIAGRYNKFCRSLPQTPWLINGERRMESSVEELISAPVLEAFGPDGINFSSSGREDVDVRTLGNGRPFAMELVNPHRSRLSREQMLQLQESINKSSEKVQVRDLQIVSRDAMSRMKEGEEDKTKTYTALVWTQKAISSDDIMFIDNIKDLTLDQKTPLRVLHRRALAVRQRVIHSMNTRYLDPHHFYLGLKTQAGTYVKEFVHGDFGRTKPNLCELLETDADILELDVESVDVDWPPALPD